MDERQDGDEKATVLIRTDIHEQERDQRANQTTIYTCPECGGTLWQVTQEGLTQFRCHVGHVYGTEVLLGSMSEEVEAVLWRCVRLLVEKATLTRQLSERMRSAGLDRGARRLEEQAADDDRQGQIIRDLLNSVSPAVAQTSTVVEILAEASDDGSAKAPQPQP